MNKPLCEEIRDKGLEDAINSHIEKRERALNRFWLITWIITIVSFVLYLNK